jgi:hypothetical protein
MSLKIKLTPAVMLKHTAAWNQYRFNPAQLAFWQDEAILQWLNSGRRSGKTDLALKKTSLKAWSQPYDKFMLGGPTHQQVKKVLWGDAIILNLPFIEDISMSDKVITLKNGCEMHFMGLDEPDRCEGVKWNHFLITEYAKLKSHAWFANLKPALDTEFPDGRVATGIFESVPEGINHWYERCQYALEHPGGYHSYHTWTSEEVLSAAKIEEAKNSMDTLMYDQEYLAKFVQPTGRIYPDYCEKNHTTQVMDDVGDIYWAHDFNYKPLSSVVMIKKGETYYAVDEIVLENAVARQAAQEFAERFPQYKKRHIRIYGDASGQAGGSSPELSDYQELVSTMKHLGFTNISLFIPPSNPLIKECQNALRAYICTVSGARRFMVNPAKCKVLNKGLNIVSVKPGSSTQEVEIYEQHITTAARYLFYYISAAAAYG